MTRYRSIVSFVCGSQPSSRCTNANVRRSQSSEISLMSLRGWIDRVLPIGKNSPTGVSRNASALYTHDGWSGVDPSGTGEVRFYGVYAPPDWRQPFLSTPIETTTREAERELRYADESWERISWKGLRTLTDGLVLTHDSLISRRVILIL